MNTSGEAADQVIRMSLNGVEVAARISGKAALEVATMLYAVMKDQKKTKGKTRLTNLLKSGKPLTVFTLPNQDLANFQKEAKNTASCTMRSATKDPILMAWSISWSKVRMLHGSIGS